VTTTTRETHELFLQFGIKRQRVLFPTPRSALALDAGFELGGSARMADQAASVRAPMLQRIAQVELDVTRVSLQIRHAMLVKTPDDLAHTLAYIGTKQGEITANLKAWLSLPAGKQAFMMQPRSAPSGPWAPTTSSSSRPAKG
jgi:hypothetical protein